MSGRGSSLRAVAVATLVAAALTGCGDSSAPTPGTVRSAAAPGQSGLQTAVTNVVTGWQDQFAHDDWNDVQSTFVGQREGQLLVRQMRAWKTEAVGTLKTAIVFSRRVGKGKLVATIKFYSDPRAVPAYGIFLFAGRGRTARAVKSLSGLAGTGLRSAGWSVSRSAHFTVYHSKFELPGVGTASLADLEDERQAFIKKFGVGVAPTASYYWYPEQSLMARLTGGRCGSNPDNVGCTFPDDRPPVIHASEWPSYHEPIHVYQKALEPKVRSGPEYVAPLFIGEGMAVALEDRQVDPRLSDYCTPIRYTPLDACARQVLSDVQPQSLLTDKGFRHANAGDSYLLGGSFVKYLILQYGYRPFGRFYYLLAAQPKDQVGDYNVATQHVFHRSIIQLLHDWRAKLCAGGPC